MSNRRFPYDLKIGDKVVLNEKGISYHKSAYRSIDFSSYVYCIVYNVNLTSVNVSWVNHKGMRFLTGWQINMDDLKFYE